MNGKELFITACSKKGINSNELFVINQARKLQKERFTCRSNFLTRKSSVKYVVGYYPVENVFVAWNLREYKGQKKSIFTLSKSSVDFDKTNNMFKAIKNIDVDNSGKENVYVFRPEAIEKFIEYFITQK